MKKTKRYPDLLKDVFSIPAEQAARIRHTHPDKVKAGTRLRMLGADVIVQEPCTNKHDGQWACMTHKEAFGNQLQKDSHISGKRKCSLLWWCFVHGPEEP